MFKGLFTRSKVAGLETEIQRLHREGFLQKVIKQKIAREFENYQQQTAIERETAQAVESSLLKKSKGLEEYVVILPPFTVLNFPCTFRKVAEYEGAVEQLQTELRRYKDNHCRSCNLRQPSDGRGTNASCKQPSVFICPTIHKLLHP